MRKIGSINLQIGLISIPLGINSFLDYQGISFKQLCPTCEKPIAYKKVCLSCGGEVDYKTLKSGFEVSKDNIVLISKEIFETLANYPTKILAVIGTNSEFEFITEKCYLLSPQKEAQKQYFLLMKILVGEKKSLVVEFVMRKKIHLAIVKPVAFNGLNFLMLKEVLYADKIKSVEKLKDEQITEEELKLGKELLNLITQKVENKNYEQITDKRAEILQKVLSGEVKPIVEKKTTGLLIEQLKASVETSSPLLKTSRRNKKKVEEK